MGTTHPQESGASRLLWRTTTDSAQTPTFRTCVLFRAGPVNEAPSRGGRLLRSLDALRLTSHARPLPPRVLAAITFQIDGSVAITSVGVSKFIILDNGDAEASRMSAGSSAAAPFLFVSIPMQSISLRATDPSTGELQSLTVVCRAPPPNDARSFEVTLLDGGTAVALPGIAAPSSQALGFFVAPLGSSADGMLVEA